MPLFGPPDVAKLQAKADVKGLIQALGYQKDSGIRTAAARALGMTGDARAVEPLLAALRDPDGNTRYAAAQSLGHFGDARAVDPLIAALKDPDRNARRAAAQSLGKIGDARAIGPLVAAFADEDVQMPFAAAASLGEIHDARAVGPLVSVLADPAGDVTQRMAATVALGGIGDPSAVDPLIAALADQNDRVVVAAAAALIGIGDGRAVEPMAAALAPVLADKESTVRYHAAVALSKIRDPRAVEALSAAANDSSEPIRKVAAEALGAADRAEAVPPVAPKLEPVPPAAVDPPRTVVARQIPAVALVCDAFMMFDSDEALNTFATRIVQSKWPGLQLGRRTHVEGATGFSGGDEEARPVLDDLLTRAADAAGLERADYDVTYFTARSETPATKVWCMAAITH